MKSFVHIHLRLFDHPLFRPFGNSKECRFLSNYLHGNTTKYETIIYLSVYIRYIHILHMCALTVRYTNDGIDENMHGEKKKLSPYTDLF